MHSRCTNPGTDITPSARNCRHEKRLTRFILWRPLRQHVHTINPRTLKPAGEPFAKDNKTDRDCRHCLVRKTPGFGQGLQKCQWRAFPPKRHKFSARAAPWPAGLSRDAENDTFTAVATRGCERAKTP